MPYAKGHKYHPPKDPNAAHGRAKANARRHKILAVAGNERIEPAVYIEYWTRVAMGLPNVRLAQDDDDPDELVYVTWDQGDEVRGALYPTQAERDAAVRELVNRTHGQAPQMHHIAATLRASESATGDLGQLDPMTVFAILDARDAARALPEPTEPTSDPHPDATDAELVELDATGAPVSSASSEQP